MRMHRAASVAGAAAAAVVLVSCGSPNQLAVSTPTPPATASPPAPLTEVSITAMLQVMYPPSATGTAGGCDAAPCPLTSRLKAQIDHLQSQTPSPTRTGDICTFSLLSGNQGGLETPVAATIHISGTTADVLVAGKGQVTPAVDLTVVDVGGAPLVDDIHYLIDQPARSVYSFSCTGSFGA